MSFHKAVNAKKITQIQWIEKCAKSLTMTVKLLDYGFPTTNMDYLKLKLATDLHLEIWLSCASRFGKENKKLREQIEIKKWMI